MMMNMHTITLRRCGCGGGKIFLLLTSLLVFFNTCRLVVSATTRPLVPQPSRPNNFQRLIGKKKVPSSWASRIALQEIVLRGGSTIDNDEEYDSDVDEEYDDEAVDDDEEETEDEYDDDEEEDEYDEEEEEEEDSNIVDQQSTPSTEYDEPYFMRPTTQMYTTFGIIMLSRKIDLFNPALVQIIRFAFIAQILIQQIFIIYVRIMAKKNNDRTPVTTQNPLSGVLQSQLGGNNDDGGGGGAMMKNLASSFLSSQTTVMEYDMQQAKSMQSGVIFNMIFMWILHFRMEQVQPLLIQATTGFMQLLYSPLFQVYILGRNLERPFKNPAMDARKKMMESQAAETEDTDDKEAAEKDESDEEDADDEDEDSDEEMDDNVDEDDQDDDEEVEDSSDAEDDATS